MRFVRHRECPMRHPDNGNCTAAGGFCTAVSDPICEALHNAYNQGKYDTLVLISKAQVQNREEEP